jgi:hypothetical protein
LTTVTAVTITLTVSDGLASTSTNFTSLSSPADHLPRHAHADQQHRPLARLGYATLTLAGDKLSAILRFNYSNLSSALTDDAIYAPGDDLLYDIPVGRALGQQQPDGSFKWVFSAAKANYIAPRSRTTART